MTFERNVEFNGVGSPVHTNAGTINIAAGAVLAFVGTDDFTNLSTGTLSGYGTLDVSASGVVFQNEGIIEVGGSDAAQTLNVLGDMLNSSSSVINIEVGNGVSDSLMVSGELTMAGTLNASFITANSPTVGDVFNVVSFGTAASGTYFAKIEGLKGDGITLLDPTFGGSMITMTAVSNALNATSGSETLNGTSAADHAFGGDGDDIISVSDNSFHFIAGGDGTDTLVAHNGLDLTVVRNDIIKGFEVLDLGFGALTLTGKDVYAMTAGTNALTGTEHTLVVTRNDFGAAIDIGTGWGAASTATLTNDDETKTFDKQVNATTGATIYVEQTASNLNELTSAIGIQIDGEIIGDFSGLSVSSAGDVNGDGFADFIIGAPAGDSNQTASQTNTGAAYVVFGSADGLVNVDLASISAGDGSLGFKLEGGVSGDNAGSSVSALGDINGDGIDDIIVGAPDAGNDHDGAAYVIFGKTSGFDGAYNLDALGSDGFKISGTAADDKVGTSVGGQGDINGDGINDIILGSPQSASSTGKAYVIYGSAALGADITTSAITGVIGTTIDGANISGAAGSDVSIAGDINGDGYDDVLVGAVGGTGRAFVLFGKEGGLGNSFDLSTLESGDGSLGFKVYSNGSVSGFAASVSVLGDLNGDGYDDIIIGADNATTPTGAASGAAYVVYGKASGFSATIDVDSLDGTDGFRIQGPDADSHLVSVAAAGDVNGDGLDDMIVGTDNANSGVGSAYVIFGSTDGFASDLTLSDLSSEQGFALDGGTVGDKVGQDVNAAGDVNGDGFDDLIIGSTDLGSSDAGTTYVVYGGDFSGVVDTVGTEGDDVLIGSSHNDTLDGGDGGADVFHAGAGNDTIKVGDANFARVDGGGGQDTLYLDGQFDLDLTAISKGIITGIEHIDMNNGLANVLDIDFASVLDIGVAIDNLVGESNMLVVSRDSEDTVNLIGNWTQRAEQPAEATSQGYTVFDSDDTNVSVALQNITMGGA